MEQQVAEIVAAIKEALPKRRPIEHHEPDYGDKETNSVAGCLASGVVGHKFVRKFEEKLREITGAEQVVGVSSGTAALHVALLAAGIKAGDEVIVPSSTFCATANAVVFCGATPHFLDCGLTMKPFKLRQYLATTTKSASDRIGRVNKVTGRRISAVIPVHLLGFPTDMPKLMEVANEFGLVVVEDACQAIGSHSQGNHCGTYGVAGVLSFNNNKVVTTNGGGAVLTNDPWIAAKVSQLATTSRRPHPWLVENDEVAWNYRIGNLNAAFGVAQLGRLDDILSKKYRMGQRYLQYLDSCGGVSMASISNIVGDRHNLWLASIQVAEGLRDRILQALHGEGIRARALFTPLHQLPMYKDNPRSAGQMLESEAMFKATICLPSGPNLIEEI